MKAYLNSQGYSTYIAWSPDAFEAWAKPATAKAKVIKQLIHLFAEPTHERNKTALSAFVFLLYVHCPLLELTKH